MPSIKIATQYGSNRAVERDDLAWAAGIVIIAVLYYEVSSAWLSLVALLALAYLCGQRTALAVALATLAVPLYMLPKTVHIGAHAESFSLGETVLVLLTVMVLLQGVYCYASRPSSTVPLWRYFVPETPF